MNHTIHDALDANARQAALDSDRELSMRAQIADTFRGRFRWLAMVTMIYKVVFLALAIFAAVQFFRVDTVRELIAYATLFLMCPSCEPHLPF